MTKNNKKKKTAREKRILVGAFLTAVVIAAGSTFAWFTSSDTVTNRLSANADYNVAIAESFSPPKNWLPGQKVDKDVYAVNTGNIDAFVKASISGRLSVTREEPVTGATWDNGDPKAGKVTSLPAGTDWGDLITLDEKEYYSMEAGSYLAYKPAGDTVNKLLGNKIVMMTVGGVGYDEVNTQQQIVTPASSTTTYTVIDNGGSDVTSTVGCSVNGNNIELTVMGITYSGAFDDDSATNATVDVSGVNYTVTRTTTTTAEVTSNIKTDFTPAAEGLYVFRRAIGVNEQGYETFDYAGYYYKDGVYYKVMNLAVTSDTINDKMNDGVESDGQLVNATADFVKEVSEVKDPVDMTYEPGNHRLVVTYGHNDYDTNWNKPGGAATDYPDMDQLATDLDTALHNLAEAQAALDRAGIDYDSYQAQFAKYSTLKAQYEKMKADYETELAQLTTAKGKVDTAQSEATSTQSSTAGNSGDAAGVDTAYGSLNNIFGSGNATLDQSDSLKTIGGNSEVINGGYTGTFKLGGENGTSYTVDDFVDALDKGTFTLPDTITAGLLKDYTAAKTAFDALNPPMDNQYIRDYMNELKTIYSEKLTAYANANTTTIDALTYDQIIDALTYSDLTSPSVDFSQNNEAHNYYTALTNMKQARETLDEKLAELRTQLNTLKKYTDDLGKAGNADTDQDPVSSYPVDNNPHKASNEKTYINGTAGYLDEQKRLETEIANLEARINALDDAIAAANGLIPSSSEAPANLNGSDDPPTDGAIKDYNDAYKEYEAALAAYNKGQDRAEYESDLVIYINLLNDIENGGIGEKWQILPKALVDTDNNNAGDTAVFYYTSILQRGQISKQLVDNIELANTVTQETYKSFEFDINVELESAQITYADDNVTIKPDAANETFNYKVGNTTHDITATLTDNQKIDTAITWTDSAATP